MSATGTEKRVCEDIAKRQELGIQKYKTTIEDNPLPLREWLQHAYLETLDKAIYLKRAIEEIDNAKHESSMMKALEFEIPNHSLACVKTGDDGNYLFLNNGEGGPIVSYDSCQCKNKEHRKLLPFGNRKGFNA